MKPSKPLFLKTYGKQRLKIPAWFSPEDRKKAFDSTPSSDDTSAFEAAGPRMTRGKNKRVVGQRAERLAKKKAMLRLTWNSVDGGNVLPSPPSRVQSKRKRGNSRSVSSSKQTAILCPSDTSSNEENIMKPTFLPTKRRTTARRRGQGVSNTSKSEGEASAPKLQKIQAKTKMDSNIPLPSAGRFVTRRRRALSTKPPQTVVSLLNSSDDFASGPFNHNSNQRPSRRRRPPPAFGLSGVDSSVNGTRTTVPFREISLTKLTENSLGPVPSKPIFCSTPSAPSFNKRRPPKFPTRDFSPPSALGSSIGALGSFQEDPGSLCTEKPQEGSSHDGKNSLNLFYEPDGNFCSYDAERRCGGLEGRESAGVNLLSADSESSSLFVSAAGGLEWLIEALRERCLNQPCRVLLHRLKFLPMTQLCCQTTYSSCLEPSGADSKEVHPPSEWTQTFDLILEESTPRRVSLTSNKSSDYSLPVSNSDKSALAVNVLQLPDFSSRKPNVENSESVIYIDDTQNSCKNTIETKLPAGDATNEEAKTAEIRCKKKCTIFVKKLSRSQLESPRAERDVLAEAAGLRSELKETALTSQAAVKVKKVSLSELTESVQPKGRPVKFSADVADSSGDEPSDHFSDSECCKDSASLKTVSKSSSSSSSDQPVTKSSKGFPKRDNRSLVPKEMRRRRSRSADRTTTTRRACVSGMSVSRWKKSETAGTVAFSGREAAKKCATGTAVDGSISELISDEHNEFPGAAKKFVTPLRTSRLNLSSMLADITLGVHTWSRLKAALSVHRKNTVQLTPRSLPQPVMRTPGRTRLSDVSQDLFATPRRTPLPRRLQSQLLSEHSLGACEDLDLTDAEKVYAECGQPGPLPWEEFILPHRKKQCVKIGEGTFGEVFSTTNAAGDTVALKIIPLEGSEKVNGEDQKTFGEILHEIIISKELSSLKEKQQNQTRGFIGLNDLHCVQGCYPPDFLKAWDAFDKCKGSENDRPDCFEKDQLFIILEFEFGGVDLENSNGTLGSLVVAKSILHQVTAALAVAEQELHFEHRDLHWGNVLVKTTKEKTGTFLLNRTAHSVETKGVLVRIIDYSLSRLEIDDLTVSCDISNDEELFMGQGDYQFEIYRLMRQENGNEWSSYRPHTNVLWLHYLCSKLLSMKYRKARGRGSRDAREELTCFYDNVLQYSSATDTLQNCPMFQ